MPNVPATPDTLLLPLSAPMTTPNLMDPTMATYVHQDLRVPFASADVAANVQSALDEPLAWDPTADDGLLDLDDLDVLATLAGDDGFTADTAAGCHAVTGVAAVWAAEGEPAQ